MTRRVVYLGEYREEAFAASFGILIYENHLGEALIKHGDSVIIIMSGANN